jgi:uncharacterized protein YdbL (DUF1318 family)
MKTNRLHWMMMALMALLIGANGAMGSTKDELRSRFEQRFPKLAELKGAGKIGETFNGSVEAVSGGLSAAEQRLVDDENTDRTELYGLIAKQENTTPQLVAERNARRNFERAHSGEFLKDKEGKWHKK